MSYVYIIIYILSSKKTLFFTQFWIKSHGIGVTLTKHPLRKSNLAALWPSAMLTSARNHLNSYKK